MWIMGADLSDESAVERLMRSDDEVRTPLSIRDDAPPRTLEWDDSEPAKARILRASSKGTTWAIPTRPSRRVVLRPSWRATISTIWVL